MRFFVRAPGQEKADEDRETWNDHGYGRWETWNGLATVGHRRGETWKRGV